MMEAKGASEQDKFYYDPELPEEVAANFHDEIGPTEISKPGSQRKLKQMLVMRKDLKCRRGKEIAQCCHASLKAVLENRQHPNVIEWLNGKFTKVAVGVNSEEELLAIHEKALNAGLISVLIRDSGLTEFHGVPTNTCIAVGPATDDDLAPITGHLKLL